MWRPVRGRSEPVALFGYPRNLIWDGDERLSLQWYLQLKNHNPRPELNKKSSMNKVQNTRGYERYMALDIHREYILAGAWNEERDWILMPRWASTE